MSGFYTFFFLTNQGFSYANLFSRQIFKYVEKFGKRKAMLPVFCLFFSSVYQPARPDDEGAPDFDSILTWKGAKSDSIPPLFWRRATGSFAYSLTRSFEQYLQ